MPTAHDVISKIYSKGWTNEQTRDRNPLRHCRTGDTLSAGKDWRALTQPHLIEQWLMKNDFKPVVDHRFNLRADWGAVDCQVLAVEPNKTLSYTWAAYGLESIVNLSCLAAAAYRGDRCQDNLSHNRSSR
jgi:Activator of Hsp90 ATPase homolog 1-like protein